jgi:signal transduction histidine kinase
VTAPSLVAQVQRVSLAVLVAVLAATGLATATLLHVQHVQARDAALLAAAQSWGRRDWAVEHAHSAIDVRLAQAGDPLLPAGWSAREEEHDGARFRNVGDERVLLLPVERGDEEHEEHAVLIARAARVTLSESLGPFATAFTLVAALAAGAGAALQRRLLLRATAPLVEARGAVETVVGAGSGARVPEDGPEEVAALLRAINGLLERLDHAFQAQARFTAEAAHELRTPVTAMLGELDVALRRPRTAEEYVAVLVSAREEVARLGALVEGLLQLARVDSGHAEQGRTPIRLRTLLRDADHRERAAIERAGGELLVEPAPDAWLHGHSALLLAAIANLLRNASVHAPGTRVALRARLEGPMVRIEVEDGGPGIAPGEREAVFDRLARGGRARRDSAGLGLGLPLSRAIARRHGGDCRIEASPGGGCRAVLVLPVAAGATNEDDDEPAPVARTG